jgi:magnesium transporter
MDDTTVPEVVERPWEDLERLLDEGQREPLVAYFEQLAPAEVARCIDRLDSDHRDMVLGSLDAETAAELLEHLTEAQGLELMENAEPAQAAAIVEELSSDWQADLLAAMPAESAESILEQMDPEAAQAARALAAYPSDTAGGLMMREFVFFEETASVKHVIEELRRRADEIEDLSIQYIYVVNANGALTGVLPLRDVLLARGNRLAGDVMIAKPATVSVAADMDAVLDMFEETGFLGLPVADDQGQMVGIVHRSDVDEAFEERAERRRLQQQGIVGGEELRSMPVWRRSYRRLSWLSANIVLNLMAASVIAGYQDTLSAVISLAVFLPIISDMSGCSGNQAVAVSMRELTLGVIKPVDVFYVWRKELAVGLINGLVLGVLLGVTAYLWQGNVALSLVVGIALALNSLVAVSIGGAVPLLLRRFGKDPALASGPILTTLTDMCGFFLVLKFATFAMAHLLSA